jgi:hypothetical protein
MSTEQQRDYLTAQAAAIRSDYQRSGNDMPLDCWAVLWVAAFADTFRIHYEQLSASNPNRRS